jgi:spermidine synthase
MNRIGLYVVVALSGASVLAIEILGTRLLGPYYGVSLYLWSALISVTLAALAVGYALGGRWADRDPSASRLAVLLAVAGVWMMAVPWARGPLLGAAGSLGLRTAVLVAAFALFFPPLALLGMVSPFAIRIHASRLESVGRVAGDLYAISTFASVAAALATGFWLIPSLGVTRLAAGIGVVLVIAALVAWLTATPSRAPAVGALLILLPGVAGVLGLSRPESVGKGGLRFLAQSPYAEIRVVDRKELRYLLIDGGVHTIVKPGTYEIHHPYVHVAELARELFDHPGEMLLIGLGGGSATRLFARHDWKVQSVEIDPTVVRDAHEHFGLRAQETDIAVMDGRRFLTQDARRWDLIFLDAFGSSAIPFHLVTREAFALAHSRLAGGGVLLVNVEAVGWDDVLVRSLGATLATEFRHVLALPIAEPPDRLGNVILLAADRPMEISDAALGSPLDWLYDPYLHWQVLLRNHAWDNRFVPETKGAPILTDDLNPVDLWAERINRVARRELHDFFGTETPSW